VNTSHDPRTPVIVGVAQLNRRPTETELETAAEPVDMMAEVVRGAAADAGVGDALLARASALRVLRVTEWHYEDAAALLASRLGITPSDCAVSGLGGNSPQRLVTELAARIQSGECDVAILCGAEAAHTVALAQRVGATLPWTPDTPTDLDVAASPRHASETAVGLRSVREYFPLLDNAVRGRSGATIAEHTDRIGRMWSNYSRVAATNPYAWSPRAREPDEITTVTDDNRMICFPYTKVMNAYARVDQAAAVILCSVATARDLGIPEACWVVPLAGADCDEGFVSERVDLGLSAGMRANTAALTEATGVGVDEVAHLDVYACFPAPPQLAADALGVPVDDPDRPLTCTGGLAFAGGPGNNYMTHAIANVVHTLRLDPDERAHAITVGVGWYATTHSMGLYGKRAVPGGFRAVRPSLDDGHRRSVAVDYEGPGTIETYTVSHARDGAPERAFLAVRTPDGARAWAASTDADLMHALETEELLGRPVAVTKGVARC
jgi:acetyl-CoA C-acetyltransferase